jgi:protein arginine kinase activator
MDCEKCQKTPATVHLTQVVDGEVRKLHLCEECARESGVDLQGPMAIADLLLGMGKPAKPESAGGDGGTACPRCRLRQADFKKTGRLGCPACYETFAAELGGLVRAMHRSEQHAGKIPRSQEARVRASAEAAMLQRELDRAVAAEQFERAAELRDRLQTVRRRLGGGDAP